MGNEPVGKGPAVVHRDGGLYYFVRVGRAVATMSPPEDRLFDGLLYPRSGTDSTDLNDDLPVVSNGVLRFDIGFSGHHDYLYYRLPTDP
jgi:hypothetical protein